MSASPTYSPTSADLYPAAPANRPPSASPKAAGLSRAALAKWDAAVGRFHAVYPLARSHGSRAMRRSLVIFGDSPFALGCDWQAAAFEAGLGRVDRPGATAYPVDEEIA